MRSDYIEDGYTEPYYVEGVSGLHGEFRFTGRPLIRAEQTKHFAQGEGEAFDKGCHEIMARHILSWSLKDSQGVAVPISAASAAKIRPELRAKIYTMILGTRASDRDPEDARVPVSGEVRSEADAKN